MNREYQSMSNEEAVIICNIANQCIENDLKDTIIPDGIKNIHTKPIQVHAVHKALWLRGLIEERINAETA